MLVVVSGQVVQGKDSTGYWEGTNVHEVHSLVWQAQSFVRENSGGLREKPVVVHRYREQQLSSADPVPVGYEKWKVEKLEDLQGSKGGSDLE